MDEIKKIIGRSPDEADCLMMRMLPEIKTLKTIDMLKKEQKRQAITDISNVLYTLLGTVYFDYDTTRIFQKDTDR